MQKPTGPHSRFAFRDKYLAAIGIAVFMLVSFVANAQKFQYPNPGTWGTQEHRRAPDSTFYFPTGCGVPTDTTWLFSQGFGAGQKLRMAAKYYDSCGHHEYVWDPSLMLWHITDSSSGGGGSTDTTSLSNRINSKKDKVDSVGLAGYSTNANRQKLADSLAAIFNSLFKLSTDSVRLSGYTTIANKNKLADSLTAVFNSLIGSYKLGSDSVRLSGFTTVANKNKLADSLTANFNALLTLYKLKGDSVALGGYTTVAHANKIADSLRGVFNTLLGGKVDTGTKANIYFRGKGQPGDTSYVYGRDSTIWVRAKRDSLGYHHTVLADSSEVDWSLDSTGANALQTKYRSDTARIRQDAAIASKVNITDTSNKWLNRIYRSGDSVYQCKGSTCVLAFMDSLGSGGGTSTPDSIQVITSGSTATISNGVNIVYIDPSSTLSSLVITLPATPHATKKITFFFGGTLTTGAVVTSLSFVANTGQSLLQASVPSTVYAGDFAISYKERVSNTKWYREN